MKDGSVNSAKDVVVRGEPFVSVPKFQAPHSQLTARVTIIAHVQPLRSVNVVGFAAIQMFKSKLRRVAEV